MLRLIDTNAVRGKRNLSPTERLQPLIGNLHEA